MRSIWMLAAVATIVACAGRGEDDMGAAPDRGDTTTVTTGADTTQWDTTGGVGQTAEPGMIPDTTGTTVDTGTVDQYPTYPDPATPETPTDTTMDQTGAYPADTTSTMGQDPSATGGYDTTTGYDTTGTTGYDTTGAVPADPGMSGDTTGWETDSANVDHGAGDWQGDSAMTDHNVPAEPGQ